MPRQVPSAKEALILGLLPPGEEKFGLRLVKESNGELRPGTAYVTLQRMEKKGYLTSRQEEVGIGSPIRWYKRTPWGEQIFSAWEQYRKALG